MSYSKLERSLQYSLKVNEIKSKINVVDWSTVDESNFVDEPILLPYQIEILNDESNVIVVSKGRQIGFSNLCAIKSVLTCIENKRDVVINSYNLSSSRELMRTVVMYARIFNQVYTAISNTECINNNLISVLQITFNNGRSITSVSGDTVNLRGRSGNLLILDEIAYRTENLTSILAAASATLIHGGKIILGSTFCGTSEFSDFAKLCEDIDNGLYEYEHYHIPFKTAVHQGLYKRICQKNNEKWEQNKENKWINEIYANYPKTFSQELDAIPSDFDTEGDIFSSFEYTTNSNYSDYEKYLELRYIDIASSTKESSFYTASVKVVLDIVTKNIVIVDWMAEKLNPSDGDERIIEIVTKDSPRCITVLEQEPGSSSMKYIEIMKQRFADKGYHRIDSYRPVLSKLQRLLPCANAVAKGEVKVLDNPYNRKLVSYLIRACNKKIPLVSDTSDCLSGIYDYALNKINYDLYF